MADSDEVKAILSSILVSEKNGLTLQALEAEYRSMNGAGIPFKSLGHATLQAYFESIPDAVTLRRGPAGEWMAQVVCTTETAHVRRMVAEQKSGKPGPYRPPKNWNQKPRRQVTQPYRPLANRSARNPQRPNATSNFVVDEQRQPSRPWNNGPGGAPFRPKMWSNVNRFAPAPHNPQPIHDELGPRCSAQYNGVREHDIDWNVHKHSMNWNVQKRSTNWNVRKQSTNWNVRKMPSNRPAVQRVWQRNVPINRKGDRDGGASTVASWVMFLVSADVHPGLVRRYAALLSKQGLTPDNAWVMSIEDLFRVGVRNSHDIRLIQRHAHKVGAAMGMVDDGEEPNEDSFSMDLALPWSAQQSSAGKRSASSRTIADRSGVLQVTVRNERCGEQSTADALSTSSYEVVDMCCETTESEDSSDDENVPPPKVLSQVRRASRGFKVTPMKRVSALRRLD
ncbi:hypothetical protein ISCGN_025500 [Ixodes scapularis]